MKSTKQLFLTLLLPAAAILFFGSTSKRTNGEFEHGTIQIGVVVSDFEKSLDFYTNVLGMTKTGGFLIDKEFGKRSGLTGGESFEVAILKLVDSPHATEWKLMSFGQLANHPLPVHIQDDTGVQYVTVFVKSMKPFLERFEHHHIATLGDTPTTLADGRKFVLIQDPDGTFIELIGPE
ncbi:MAG: VOC family protein [Saprospiraceae bacterium]|nr:MAG: VOC family protein [Saprospiraceae bacterium]